MAAPYRPPYRGRSLATPTTLCQNYECKASAQERPYASRPSRTQQLFNPKLVPKLTSDVPNDLLQKKGVADQLLAKNAEERGRKRAPDGDDTTAPPRKRTRSVSSYSSSTVSTISTNLSRSPSPKRAPPRDRIQASIPPREGPPHRSRSPDRKRRRRSYSSSPDSDHKNRQRGREPDRNTRRRLSSFSPDGRGRQISRSSDRRKPTRSREENRSPLNRRLRSPSPYSGRRDSAPRRSPPRRSPPRRRPRSRSPARNGSSQQGDGRSNRLGGFDDRPPLNGASNSAYAGRPPPHVRRERSLSPYSKRLALTQAMGTGGGGGAPPWR
ncbi:hypothetical protein W97_02091 [Coniosporium apollinis CBS 100218]|uniref:Uncharacterized protein n=1 Tax=Coniosporium apollinis (strain CBS 100218) TaxID=1168221 RepID=R7YMI1_CONA1|nr:uncharacterized protein W97_02091 [Coniosporium apollinis CBS 100218]EON62866.1 hypothetical protein W97_02091 [Coniosporium apollinis CBS 100218]